MIATQAAFLGCGFIGIGLIFMVIGAVSLRPARNTRRWQRASGEVIFAKVIRTADGSRRPLVQYRYTVGDQVYSGSRMTMQDGGLFLAGLVDPSDAAARYQDGQSLTVYYDPASPDRSVLQPGAGLPVYLPIGLGGLFFILGLAAGILALM